MPQFDNPLGVAWARINQGYDDARRGDAQRSAALAISDEEENQRRRLENKQRALETQIRLQMQPGVFAGQQQQLQAGAMENWMKAHGIRTTQEAEDLFKHPGAQAALQEHFSKFGGAPVTGGSLPIQQGILQSDEAHQAELDRTAQAIVHYHDAYKMPGVPDPPEVAQARAHLAQRMGGSGVVAPQAAVAPAALAKTPEAGSALGAFMRHAAPGAGAAAGGGIASKVLSKVPNPVVRGLGAAAGMYGGYKAGEHVEGDTNTAEDLAHPTAARVGDIAGIGAGMLGVGKQVGMDFLGKTGSMGRKVKGMFQGGKGLTPPKIKPFEPEGGWTPPGRGKPPGFGESAVQPPAPPMEQVAPAPGSLSSAPQPPAPLPSMGNVPPAGWQGPMATPPPTMQQQNIMSLLKRSGFTDEQSAKFVKGVK